jgi:ADP-ribose pyrophosphatase YjhB (NUDIX family)
VESPGWLTDDEYRRVREIVPIVCVDVLPWRDGAAGREIGLITRAGDRGRPALSLVGGRVRRDETLEDAVRRHVTETLGTAVSYDPLDMSRPMGVFEYFPDRARGPFVDPSKHAVAMTYTARLSGEPQPAGEARSFEWFAAADPPPTDRFGFGHGEVVRRLLPRVLVLS